MRLRKLVAGRSFEDSCTLLRLPHWRLLFSFLCGQAGAAGVSLVPLAGPGNLSRCCIATTGSIGIVSLRL